jgi:hypothetical protein
MSLQIEFWTREDMEIKQKQKTNISGNRNQEIFVLWFCSQK